MPHSVVTHKQSGAPIRHRGRPRTSHPASPVRQSSGPSARKLQRRARYSTTTGQPAPASVSPALARTATKGYQTGGQAKAASSANRLVRAIQHIQKAYHSRPTSSGLDSEQNKVLGTVLKQGKKLGATKTEKLSAVETGLVESNLRNLPGGDADSAGWRQERASIYPNPTNVKASAKRYFSETRAVRGSDHSAGEIAADVQRPAAQYRGRYGEEESRARTILKSTRPAKKPSRQDLRIATKAGVKLPALRHQPEAGSKKKPFAKAAAKVSNVGGIRENPKWAPGEAINRGINPIVKKWAKKYGAQLTAGYDPGGGHVSPGHNETGTATDMIPRGGWTPTATARFEKGLKVLSAAGFEVLYGTDGIGQAYPNHGRGNHAHIEWADVGNGWSSGSSAALQKLGGYSDAQMRQIQSTRGSGASAMSGGSLPSGAVASYASSTGQSAQSVRAKLRSGKLTIRQILAKIEDAYPEHTGAPSANLSALKHKYGNPAI